VRARLIRALGACLLLEFTHYNKQKSCGGKFMGIAHAHQQVFKTMLRVKGQTIIVHENFNTPEATYYEVKGLRSTAGNRSSQVLFQFPEPLDFKAGAVLQAKGSRDYWRVTDTEDIVEEDKFINFEARVEKINVSGQPTRPSLKGGPTYNLHGTHARVNIQSQDSSINISHQVTENVFADMRQVIQTHIENEEERTVILNKLSEMEEAKGSPNFTDKYREFISSAANHMSVLAPFIPALSQMLGG
jgi:hypothetical protein